MLAINGLLKSLVTHRSRDTSDRLSIQNTPAVNRTLPGIREEQLSADDAFLASIAHLPPEEQHKHIEKRLWYIRLAQRQGVIEAEHPPAQFFEEGKQPYRLY